VFADEIEVLGPADSATRTTDTCAPGAGKPSAPVADTLFAFWNTRALRRARLAIDHDAADITDHLSSLNLTSDQRQSLTDQLHNAAAAAKDALSAPLTALRLPLNVGHQIMYAIAADAERAAREPQLSIWTANSWDPLSPLARPVSGE